VYLKTKVHKGNSVTAALACTKISLILKFPPIILNIKGWCMAGARCPVLSGKEIVARIIECLEPDLSLGRLIKDLDFKKGTVYGWNEKNIVPKAQDIVKIARYLRLPVYWLLTGEDEAGLTDEQLKLISEFENLNPQGKTLVIEHIEGLIKHFPQKRISKKSTAG
jgi:hypothetical protein